MALSKLSDQQRRFADFVLQGLSHTEAYRKAGYRSEGQAAESNASRLIRNDKVVAYLEKHRKQAERRTEVTIDWVLSKLKENVERSMTAIPVYDAEGEPTGEYRYNGNVANKALELLGKHLGMFEQQHEERDSEELTEMFKAMVRATQGGGESS